MRKITFTLELPNDFTREETQEWISSMKRMAAHFVKDTIGKRAEDLGEAVAKTIEVSEEKS